MIKSIELWDWESHKHTYIDDLSDGLNLIFGDSNTGKTSIIRAIKFIAYNDFNSKSIRVGSSSCSVEVITDKGRVKVTRSSSDNNWEVQKNNSQTQIFQRIGKSVLPEVSEVLGLNLVSLGDIEIPINIVNQLEGHFMLSDLNGKSASGSMRAQIIDEISGLSGIEGLIKDVGLDSHRLSRDIKSFEKQNQDLICQLNDEDFLRKEKELLTLVGESMNIYSEGKKTIDLMNKFQDDLFVLHEKLSENQNKLDSIIDTERVRINLSSVEQMIGIIESANKIHENSEIILKKISDIEERQELLDWTDDCFDKLDNFDCSVKKMIHANSIIEKINVVDRVMSGIIRKLSLMSVESIKLKREIDEIIKSIEICPITGDAIVNGCCMSSDKCGV